MKEDWKRTKENFCDRLDKVGKDIVMGLAYTIITPMILYQTGRMIKRYYKESRANKTQPPHPLIFL